MSSAPGPQRPTAAVYRRRRLVVGVAALVVLALVVWGIVAGIKAIAGAVGPNKGNTTTSAPPSTGSTPATDEPAEETTAGATPAGANPDGSCPAAAVQITAATDQKSYATKEKPVLRLKVKNTLKVACTANVGTKAQEFIVTSGSDRIFSTADCQKDAADYKLELQPGKEELANFTWDRQRSQPGCTPIAAEPRPGTYTLQVKLGKTTSDKVQFFLK